MVSSRAGIVGNIEHLRKFAHDFSTHIQRYANEEDAYWDPEAVSIGITPSLDVMRVTVTENPNTWNDLFIDTLSNPYDHDGSRCIAIIDSMSECDVSHSGYNAPIPDSKKIRIIV